MELKVACDYRCKMCHSIKLFLEIDKDDEDNLILFIVCSECGFDCEAKKGDIEYES